MQCKKYKKLDNAPIKQVVLGLELNGLFSSNDAIHAFENIFPYKDSYNKRKRLNSVTVDFSEGPKILKNSLEALEIISADECQVIHIEANKIFYTDLNKYIDFDTFYNKFCPVLDEVIKHFGGETDVMGVGLRYVNNFKVPINEVNKKFKILPTINFKCENETYAKILNYFTITNIVADFNPSIEANIKTAFRALKLNKLEILFDIDTYYEDKFKLKDINELKNNIMELKEFKNHIFFDNFVDIDNMEEFN